MLDILKVKNPQIKFYSVEDKEFSAFGRIIKNIDVTEITKVSEKFDKNIDGSSYLPSVKEFEALEIADKIKNECFGTLPTQIGYCWGKNSMLNATEWHTSSEINIAITPLVLILGHIWDIKNGKIDSSDFKAFYLPAGTVVEVYATSLHYCPCQVSDSGFGSVVGLPLDTNTNLEIKPENPLIFRKNKWIICHVENKDLIDVGVVAGITGTNFEIKY